MRRSIIWCCMLAWLACGAANVYATRTVPGTDSDLQSAINNAASGEEIRVASDFVNDMATPVWIGGDAIDVNICSYDPAFTAPQTGAQAARFDIGVTNGSVRIDGFVVDSTTATLGAVRIFNLSDVWNSTVATSSTYEIVNCDLKAGASDRGVFIHPSCNASTFTLSNSTIHDTGFAMNLESGAQTRVENCQISNILDSGITYASSASSRGVHFIVDTTIENITYGGIYCWEDVNLTIDGCTIQDVGNQAIYCNKVSTLTVNNSTFQRNVNSNYDGVFIASGGMGSHVVMTGVTIDGFKRHGLNFDPQLTGSFTDCVARNNGGQGFSKWVFGTSPSQLIFTRFETSGNSSDGIAFNGAVQATLIDCTMQNNGGHGIIKGNDNNGQPLLASQISMTGSLVAGNAICGILGNASSQRWIVNQCIVEGNTYEPIHINNTATSGVCDLVMDGSVVRGSAANTVAGVYLIGVGTVGAPFNSSCFTNCIFDEGKYNVQLVNCAVSLAHCTLVTDSSQASSTQASVYAEGNSCQLGNCILDGAAVSVNAISGATIAANNNIVNGTVTGAMLDGSNFAADPLFEISSTGVGTGDFHLTDDSPALGAGIDLGVTVDLDGAARPSPVGTPPDLGAYEDYLSPVGLSGIWVE